MNGSVARWTGRGVRQSGMHSVLGATAVLLVLATFGYARPVWDPWRDPREYVERHAFRERAFGRRGLLTTRVAQPAAKPRLRPPVRSIGSAAGGGDPVLAFGEVAAASADRRARLSPRRRGA